MFRRRPAFLSLIVACALTLGPTATAVATSAFEQTYNAYRSSGRVAPCRFSAATLQKAKSEVPPDIEQYAPDFPAALDAALQARALGACGKKGATAAAPAAGATPPSTPAGPGGSANAPTSASATPAPTALPGASAATIAATAAAKRGAGASTAPAPVIALAVILAALALAALAWMLTAWRGLEPVWLTGTRHAWSEAGYRASGTWAEFTDWLRLGR